MSCFLQIYYKTFWLLFTCYDVYTCPVVTYEVCGVALNHAAYQSSVYSHDGLRHAADLANDGRSDTCAVSNRQTNPWWIVDLSTRLTVTGVNFTNVENLGKL